MSDQVSNKQLYTAIRDSRREIKEDVGKFKEETEGKFKSVESRFDGLHAKLDQKYAAKWVERLMAGMVVTVLLAVLSALLYTVVPAGVRALGG